jgi:hypothetical protein
MNEEEKPLSDRANQILMLLSELGPKINEFEEGLDRVPMPEKADFRRFNPDQWIMQLMTTLRVAAKNVQQWHVVRVIFIKMIALLVVMLRAGDNRFGKNIITPPGFNHRPS